MRALHTTQFPEAGPEMLSSYGTVNEFGFIANPASASLTSYYNITTMSAHVEGKRICAKEAAFYKLLEALR
ncbi:uncharacterized protein PHALS_08025 [Plasmopara halstedii]|uniref:Uncharacterized protein n=1 Tax=Plasmopara halstedii TaxID=4781 RepID=A0A0P1B832_PLAHL|nr:uncharacterized protein PHALS_08025 [Plasmopara halstedii]CEG50304.1 hypothetical protein PHALS_08025 [Plasmopara halstedii]|eukprot:XP_024586673.1 hypothetical protein PHALS_08025 [Plasmopara halstedii]